MMLLEVNDKENISLSKSNSLLLFSPGAKSKSTKDGKKVKEKNNVIINKFELPVLLCTHFQSSLYLEFGYCEKFKPVTKKFELSNPNKSDKVVISVEKVPISKGFSVSLDENYDNKESQIEIEPSKSVIGTVTWIPNGDMTIREHIVLKLNGIPCLQITLQGSAGLGEVK